MIPTRVHGMIDYASALLLAAGPRLLGWDRRARRLTDPAAALTLAYALGTRYELGAFSGLTMRQHLAVDVAEGIGFLTAAALMEREPPGVRAAMAAYGVFALAAASMSEDRSYQGNTGPGRRTRTGAFVMEDETYRPSLSLRDRAMA
ncbi:MAG TPA: hypothetical protein VEH84_18865 [Alphaproteobacteria bacterium]|nr:hypothetical protein [Alphaproteobacteria bacterium]